MDARLKLDLSQVLKGYSYDQDKAVDPVTTVANARARLAEAGDQAKVDLEVRDTKVDGAYSFASSGSIFNSSGKGLTRDQAAASAIMEFVERFSWLNYDYTHAPGYRVATCEELVKDGVQTVAPSYFLNNFIELGDRALYQQAAALAPLKWVQGTRIVDQTPYYYPLNWHNMLFTSNGLAAGNRLEEAILQALCEVIEREAIYRLYVERQPAADIDPDSIAHPLVRQVLENGRRRGVEWRIKDITGSLGVSVVLVRGTQPAEEGYLTHVGVGFGCHADPEKAVVRAVSEYYEGLAAAWKVQQELGRELKGLARLLPKQDMGFQPRYAPEMLDVTTGTRKVSELPKLTRSDIKEEVETVLDLLHRQGFTVVILNKTHPSLGIPVVRVFVPEMRSELNTEIQNPSTVLAAVYHEARNEELTQFFWARMMSTHPALKSLRLSNMMSALLPSAQAALLPPPPFGVDYRETLLRIYNSKKHGMEALQEMQGMKPMLGSVLGMLQDQGTDAMGAVSSLLPAAFSMLGRGGPPK